MKRITSKNPIPKANKPERMEASPKLAPTTASCGMLIWASKRPDFKIFAKSFASSKSSRPVIWEDPPAILFITLGAEKTLSSKTIAIWLPIFSSVRIDHLLAPTLFIRIDTAAAPNSSRTERASVITSPLKADLPSIPFCKANKA